MSITNGPNLGLMENANTGEAHDTALRALLRGLDGLVMPNAKGYLTNTPPGSPANGDLYIIGAAPTGAWAGQGGKVARYSTIAAAWEFFTPKNGWMVQANSARETYRYTGSAWEIFYQEGTWTPTLGGSTSFGTQTYTTQAGTYTKAGRFVYMTCRCSLASTSGATGNLVIGGIPLTPGAPGSRQLVSRLQPENFTSYSTSLKFNASYFSTSQIICLDENYGAVPASALTATSTIDISTGYII